MRSAPTSRGLSVAIGMPVLVPGSTTTGSKWKYRSTISRCAAVSEGTTLDSTTPLTWAENESPSKWRNCWNTSASSSEVRRASVEIRHSAIRFSPFQMPIWVWVLPTSTAKSIVSAARSPRQRRGR